jgi:MFS family permease
VDPSIYSITFFMGLIFAGIFFINGLIINAFGKRNLLVTTLTLCATFGAFIPHSPNLFIVMILLVGFVASGVCGNILSSILVDLFETKTRAMALSVVFSFGRLGAVFGSLMVSLMIENGCREMFWLFGGLLLLSAVVGATLVEKKCDKVMRKELCEI